MESLENKFTDICLSEQPKNINPFDDTELPTSSIEIECDRHIDQIHDDELEKIVEKMKGVEFSGCKFLEDDDNLPEIIKNDSYSIKQAALSPEKILASFDNLLKEMHKNINQKDQNGGDLTGGMVGMTNDQMNGMKKMIEMILGDKTERKPGVACNVERSAAAPAARVQVINVNSTSDWTLSIPDPVSMLQVYDPQWSLKTRSCSLVIKNETLYYVSKIVWNGSQECPFKHPDDTHYHGYEYGDRDYIIDVPVLNGEKSRDQVVIVSDLLLHMIRKHDFWGSGKFRIDPIKFANILGIGPEPVKTPCVPPFISDLLEKEIKNEK